ncbi:MAG: M14 family metallopeptidase [Ferruginibacter sp.]
MERKQKWIGWWTTLVFSLLSVHQVMAQSILPPVIEWKGKSELLVAKPGNPWITPAEKTGFVTTPTYNETMSWLKKLDQASPLITMLSIGKSPEGRDIFMVIASKEKVITATALKQSHKPILLVQAGIHSGEIDGKDAGMMLLRDIAFGNKQLLLDGVNLLFIPILNVDGHERSSSYNRPNQRGPQNMGWRTNAQNLNLNRDYAKIDTKEVRAVIQVMNEYDPLLYMDIHVTDGADYQYDVTFGGHGRQGYSPAISDWLTNVYKPTADKGLVAEGHLPGPLMFAVNDRDFSAGNVVVLGESRFSDAYGNLRHLASVLVENHSLKPYRQRVLGTYVLLESTLKILAREGKSLRQITAVDKARREDSIPLVWKVPQMKSATTFETQSDLQSSANAVPPDSMDLLGMDSRILKSAVTGSDYIEWLGKPVTARIAHYKGTEGIELVKRPNAYWVPAFKDEVIRRLQLHGIKMEIIKQPREVIVEMYRIPDAKFQDASGKTVPFEGHLQVKGTAQAETHKQWYAAGSAYITTDQPLGELAMLLLEPNSPDSYFQWGFFYEIFQRTEYIESYVMEPTIKKMLEDSPELKKEFEQKKASDAVFAKDPDAIFSWFYSKTKYYDSRYLLYPVGREL